MRLLTNSNLRGVKLIVLATVAAAVVQCPLHTAGISAAANIRFVEEASPVPSPSEIKAATDDLEKSLKVSLRSTRSSNDSQLLVTLDSALLAETEPAKRYVLLDASIRFASKAGDAKRAFELIRVLANEFQIDSTELTRESLETLGKVRRPVPDFYFLTLESYEAGRKLCDAHQYQAALEFMTLALRFAKPVDESSIQLQIQPISGRWKEWSEAYEKVESAHETILKGDMDPAANLAWGRFLCFQKRDWEAGLPFLEGGSDPALSSLAAQELEQSEDFGKILALTEAWLRFAESQSKAEADAIQSHAFELGQRGFRVVADSQLQTYQRKMAQGFGATPVLETTFNTNGLSLGGPQANLGVFGTVELWVRSTQADGAIITKREDPADSSVGLSLKNGVVHCYAHGPNHHAEVDSTQKVSDGSWHHIAAVKMGDRLALFCDGQPVEKVTVINPRLVSKTPWHIGYLPVAKQQALHATYARIRISSIARYHVPFVPDRDYSADRATLFFK